MVTNTSFQSIRAPRISLEIVRQIQESIFRGEYSAGQRLPTERDLVQLFGVSKVSVREALRVLETYGMIEIRPGASGGAFVKEMTAQPVSRAAYCVLQLGGFNSSDLYAARALLEPQVAELACQVAGDDLLVELEANVGRTKELIAEGEKTSPESLKFHSTIAEASGNPVIQLVVGTLLELVSLSGAVLPSTPKISGIVADEHDAILGAMRKRDGAAVRVLMFDHLSRLSNEFSLLESQSSQASDDGDIA